MSTPDTFDTYAICADLNRITRYDWQFKHDPLHPRLDVFESTLPDLDAARDFQATLVDHGIHFSRLSSDPLKEPALTFTLHPDEAQKFIASQTPSLAVNPVGIDGKRADTLKAITGITWAKAKDGQSFQSNPIDQYKALELIAVLDERKIEHDAPANQDGLIVVTLTSEMADSLISKAGQTSAIAERISGAAKPKHTR